MSAPRVRSPKPLVIDRRASDSTSSAARASATMPVHRQWAGLLVSASMWFLCPSRPSA
ncbi:Uncharacterised protein [Mycobacteroides abscessus subsp. abscessus]|nr:Uncharacterised protein [Mycobacteroides abscessus subsp. abscessus]